MQGWALSLGGLQPSSHDNSALPCYVLTAWPTCVPIRQQVKKAWIAYLVCVLLNMQQLTCFIWSIYNTMFRELPIACMHIHTFGKYIMGSSKKKFIIPMSIFLYSRINMSLLVMRDWKWCASTELMRWNFGTEIFSWLLPWETDLRMCSRLRPNFNELEAQCQIVILLDLDSGQVP